MTEREGAQRTMCTVVKKFMDEHTVVWSAIPAIGRYKNDLDAHLLALNVKLQTTVESTIPVTQEKTELKNMATAKAVILAGALAAHGVETGNLRLQELSDYTKTELHKVADNMYRLPIDKMIGAAREQLLLAPVEGVPPLSDQGITEEQLTDLETTLDDFSVMIGETRTLQITSALHNKAVSELIADMYEMVQDKLDKSMKRFALSNPEFYDGYQRARVLVG
jgi:hypothetical protein